MSRSVQHKSDHHQLQLRAVREDDLPRMFEIQLDPVANAMAVTYPRSHSNFVTHWLDSLQSPEVTARIISVNDQLAGWIAGYPCEEVTMIGYWLDQPFWGRGIATASLQLLLQELPSRPLFARVAVSNPASVRVLEKCGFRKSHTRFCPEDDRYPACEEVVLRLDS